MGNQVGGSGGKTGTGASNSKSNPDFSNQGSFGKAFNKAHGQLGPGSTFAFKDKTYTTNCKDGGNYRNQPLQHTYTKNSALSCQGEFKTNQNTFDARSGVHPISSFKWGSIPNATYKVSGTSNTGGITRYKL